MSKNKRSEEIEALSIFDDLLNEFINLAINRFTWENLPFGLTSEQLELLLITHGQMMYFSDDTKGEFLLPSFPTTDINFYGLPTTYQVTAENGKYNTKVELEKGVILKNNPIASANLPRLRAFAQRIDNTELTQDVNMFQQRVPKLILADEDSKMTAKSIVEQIAKFRFVIFGKKSLVNNISTSDVLDTSAPYIIDKLQQQKTEYRNEVLTYLGYNTVNIMKKERVNTEEVNANNEQTESNIDLMYEMRVKFCEEVKKKFHKNITVTNNLEKKEVETNGTGNNDDTNNIE